MEHLGVINTEGGPLLLIDFNLAQSWRGIDDDSADYQRACEAFDSHPDLEGIEISIPNGRGVLWEMRGAGTADVFGGAKGQITIVRSWLKDPVDDQSVQALAALPAQNLLDIGQIVVASGVLTVFWAVEDGRCFRPSDLGARRPSGETSVGESALIVQTDHKLFRCQHDQVESNDCTARRLHLTPI